MRWWSIPTAIESDRCRSSRVPLLQSAEASLTFRSSDPASTVIDDGDTRTLWRQRRLASSLAGAPAVVCWVSVWRRRSTLRWNALEQTRQANGLNPVCLRLCVMRFDDWLKALPHWRQTYGFSPTTQLNTRTSYTVQYTDIKILQAVQRQRNRSVFPNFVPATRHT